ncbi:hypothetical protein [Paenibacillus pseudetheri]|nr:hypothetical protein [Paenibacillus pseudetheri]
MNWLLVLGMPFGVFNRVENAMHKLTYASQHISHWQCPNTLKRLLLAK